jgi:uncharacterized protein (TIGR00255 family)
MAIKSMTGFGAGQARAGGIRVAVELSSVNRKQLDVVLRLPPQMAAFESRIQKLIQTQISRGRVSGSVQIESSDGEPAVAVDLPRAAATVDAIRRASKRLNLKEDLSASLLLQVPGLLQTRATEQPPETVFNCFEKALTAALKKLNTMRTREGKALEADLAARLKTLESMLADIRTRAPSVVAAYRNKLLLSLEQAGLENIARDERVIKEIALFGERSDISEEITRLESHIAQCRNMLRGREPSGRALDFLAQEFLREINTIGSKANDLEITQQVVAFKTELERIREQIQNVE